MNNGANSERNREIRRLAKVEGLGPTEIGRRFGISRQRVDQVLHPKRHRARQLVHDAISMGRLIRPKRCERCGKSGKIEAHHPDYRYPMWVEWVCQRGSCHKRGRDPLLPWTRIALLIRRGVSAPEIAKQLSVSASAVREIAKRKGLPLAPPPRRPRVRCLDCGELRHGRGQSGRRGRCRRCAYRNDPQYREHAKVVFKRMANEFRERNPERWREIQRRARRAWVVRKNAPIQRAILEGWRPGQRRTTAEITKEQPGLSRFSIVQQLRNIEHDGLIRRVSNAERPLVWERVAA